MISVIIPAYNAASTIGHCLEALSAQTCPPDEVIVVDDGSTDGTAQVAKSFGVRVISQPNAGPAAARNRGATAAHGDILLFTDADCIPAPDWVERMVTAFADPGVAGAKGAYLTRQREPVARFVQIEYEDRYDHMRGQPAIDFVDTYSAAYRRDVFVEAGGFDATFPTASVEDQEFSFRLAAARRKFWIGYWKARVMRTHPSKLVHDSHTPQVLKLQMGLAGLGALLIVAGLLDGRLALWGLAAWGGLLLSGVPFLVKVWRRDRAVIVVAPLLLFVRAWALGLGFLLGSIRWLGKRP